LSKINHKREKLIPSFLDGEKKEAKEPLAKFNVRDESPSHLPVDGKKRHQKSLHDFSPPFVSPPW